MRQIPAAACVARFWAQPPKYMFMYMIMYSIWLRMGFCVYVYLYICLCRFTWWILILRSAGQEDQHGPREFERSLWFGSWQLASSHEMSSTSTATRGISRDCSRHFAYERYAHQAVRQQQLLLQACGCLRLQGPVPEPAWYDCGFTSRKHRTPPKNMSSCSPNNRSLKTRALAEGVVVRGTPVAQEKFPKIKALISTPSSRALVRRTLTKRPPHFLGTARQFL